MVRLNKNQLSQKQLEGLFTQLNKSVSKLTTSQTHNFLQELLGYEERLMLAKRLACVVLLHEKTTPFKVAGLLKMSPSTVEAIRKKIQAHEYEEILKLLTKNKKSYLVILETIDLILHAGGIMPHRSGLDRYRSLR